MSYTPKQLTWCTPIYARANRALLDILPVLQNAEGPLRTTVVARLIGQSYDRTQRGLLLLHVMGFLTHRFEDRSDWKTHYTAREGAWQLIDMEETIEKEEAGLTSRH